jgi:hypothetical protein
MNCPALPKGISSPVIQCADDHVWMVAVLKDIAYRFELTDGRWLTKHPLSDAERQMFYRTVPRITLAVERAKEVVLGPEDQQTVHLAPLISLKRLSTVTGERGQDHTRPCVINRPMPASNLWKPWVVGYRKDAISDKDSQ